MFFDIIQSSNKYKMNNLNSVYLLIEFEQLIFVYLFIRKL